MTNIDGHSLVDCGGLWWIGAISSVLPMCHVHVAVFALGCEATYISIIPKIPKKSHKFFGAYLHQICKNPSLPSSKLIQQYSFSYSVHNKLLWRKCYLYILDFPRNFLGTLSYPNHYHVTKFSSICLANLLWQISKVFVHLEALWRKYLFYISKWHEIYTVPSYAQIITLLQIAAQSNHLCEPRFNLYFMAKLARCKASVI